MAVLAMLIVILATIISHTSSIWSHTRAQAEQLREARDAFDVLTRRIGEATLNSYVDYEDATGATRTSPSSASFVPKTYGTQSELRFISGPGLQGNSHAIFFQGPRSFTEDNSIPGGSRLLNSLGYYIQYGDDARFLPNFLTARNRPRLMEFCESSETLSVYRYTSGSASASDRTSKEWFAAPLRQNSPSTRVIAENVLALVLLPILPEALREAKNYDLTALAPDYLYDSTVRKANSDLSPRNQLPPLIQITMVAADEISMNRLGDGGIAEVQTLVSSRFKRASDYTTDLQALEALLTAKKVNYRIFSSNLSLKNARWSRTQ